jgi:hypothetical protein
VIVVADQRHRVIGDLLGQRVTGWLAHAVLNLVQVHEVLAAGVEAGWHTSGRRRTQHRSARGKSPASLPGGAVG